MGRAGSNMGREISSLFDMTLLKYQEMDALLEALNRCKKRVRLPLPPLSHSVHNARCQSFLKGLTGHGLILWCLS